MTDRPAPSRHAKRLLLAWGLAGVVSGCSPHGKEAEKACALAKRAITTAVTRRAFAEARALRVNAYRACDDRNALAALDLNIFDGESNQQLREALSARKQAERAAFVAFFLDFVKENRAAPDRASRAPRCDTAPDGNAGQPADAGAGGDGGGGAERFCTAHRQVGQRHLLEIRYAAADPSAFRFSTSVNGALDCAAVGGTERKRWKLPVPGGGAIQRYRCELAGPLAGLDAVVDGAPLSALHVFSSSYLAREPSARAVLDATP